ncbi:hypothetical protein ACFFWC_00150 [Plantactinospora siamensis]|uniref:Uncharacterized protein n=1 Tax=Plantactinospora siamensis TaxID=555372 RepID=A0ABV6NVD4_9ACTN
MPVEEVVNPHPQGLAGTVTDGCAVRVISIYSVPWHYSGDRVRDLSPALDLGPLSEDYKLYREQLPRLLSNEPFGGDAVAKSLALPQPPAGVTFTKSEAMIFALPSNQVVVAALFSFATESLVGPEKAAGVRAITAVLEQCIRGDITVRSGTGERIPLAEHIHRTLPDPTPRRRPDRDREALNQAANVLLPERHQLVFVGPRGEPSEQPDDDVVNEIVYRETPPYSEEFSRPQRPEQLNLTRDDRSLMGVVTPYVSLLWNHQVQVEDSIYLSTVHAVGTATTFRQIWRDSYRQVRKFRLTEQAQEVGVQTRDALEALADKLGNLEFDLTFSVEFPLMRIETFHTALYEAMDLSGQAQALSQMFGQLSGSLRSEITAIDVRERRRDDGRQKWNAFAAGVLSLIGVSVGFVIAFLGVNTTQVPTEPKPLSMWDPKFASVYLVAGLFAVVPVFLIAFPYLRSWTERRRDRWPLVLGAVLLLAGAGLAVGAYFVDRDSGRTLVIDAIMKSVGLLGGLLGASLLGSWLWANRIRSWWRKRREQTREQRAAERQARPTSPAELRAAATTGWSRSIAD